MPLRKPSAQPPMHSPDHYPDHNPGHYPALDIAESTHAFPESVLREPEPSWNMPLARVNARLDPISAELMQRLSSLRGQSITDLLKDALRALAAATPEHASALQQLFAAGLVGFAGAANANVSTAYKQKYADALVEKLAGTAPVKRVKPVKARSK